MSPTTAISIAIVMIIATAFSSIASIVGVAELVFKADFSEDKYRSLSANVAHRIFMYIGAAIAFICTFIVMISMCAFAYGILQLAKAVQ